MKAKSKRFINFLQELLQSRNILQSQLANELGISNATVSRWLAGKYIPSSNYCSKISEYSGVPLDNILFMVGHIPKINQLKTAGWPEFREYAAIMYPDELDKDTITLIEDIIAYRRQKKFNIGKDT